MAKGPVPSDLKKRMQDETRGIRPGTTREPVDFGGPDKEDAPPPPDIKELSLPINVRKQIVADVLAHADFSKLERKAAKAKAPITERLKPLIRQHLDVESFYVQGLKTTIFSQSRVSFDHRRALAILRTKNFAAHVLKTIEDTFSACIDQTSFDSLKITAPKEDE